MKDANKLQFAEGWEETKAELFKGIQDLKAGKISRKEMRAIIRRMDELIKEARKRLKGIR